MSGLDCAPMMRKAMDQWQSLYLSPDVELVGSPGCGGGMTTVDEKQKLEKAKPTALTVRLMRRMGPRLSGRCWGRGMSRCSQPRRA